MATDGGLGQGLRRLCPGQHGGRPRARDLAGDRDGRRARPRRGGVGRARRVLADPAAFTASARVGPRRAAGPGRRNLGRPPRVGAAGTPPSRDRSVVAARGWRAGWPVCCCCSDSSPTWWPSPARSHCSRPRVRLRRLGRRRDRPARDPPWCGMDSRCGAGRSSENETVRGAAAGFASGTRWLVQPRDSARVTLVTPKPVYESGESVDLRAHVLDAHTAPQAGAAVRVDVRRVDDLTPVANAVLEPAMRANTPRPCRVSDPGQNSS